MEELKKWTGKAKHAPYPVLVRHTLQSAFLHARAYISPRSAKPSYYIYCYVLLQLHQQSSKTFAGKLQSRLKNSGLEVITQFPNRLVGEKNIIDP